MSFRKFTLKIFFSCRKISSFLNNRGFWNWRKVFFLYNHNFFPWNWIPFLKFLKKSELFQIETFNVSLLKLTEAFHQYSFCLNFSKTMKTCVLKKDVWWMVEVEAYGKKHKNSFKRRELPIGKGSKLLIESVADLNEGFFQHIKWIKSFCLTSLSSKIFDNLVSTLVTFKSKAFWDWDEEYRYEFSTLLSLLLLDAEI